MRARLTLLIALALMLAGAPLRAQADPGAEIAGVIEDQLAAFQREDLDRAFSHASPGIQRIFRDPQNFGRMVREGYPMVWRPRTYEMRDLQPIGEGFVQTVMFEDAAGRFWLADYEMRLIDGVWRINGVSLREMPQFGA